MAQSFKTRLLVGALMGVSVSTAPAHAQRSTPVTVVNPVAVEVQNTASNPVEVADRSRQPFYEGVFLNHGAGTDDTCRSISAPPGQIITVKAVHVLVRGITAINDPDFRPNIYLEQIETDRAPIPTRRSTLRVTDLELVVPGTPINEFGGTLLTDAAMAGALSSTADLSFNICFGRTLGAVSGNFLAADITVYGELSEGGIAQLPR